MIATVDDRSELVSGLVIWGAVFDGRTAVDDRRELVSDWLLDRNPIFCCNSTMDDRRDLVSDWVVWTVDNRREFLTVG